MIAPASGTRVPLTPELRAQVERRHTSLRRRGWMGVLATAFTAVLASLGVPIILAHPQAMGDFGVWTSLLMLLAIVAMALMGTRGAWRLAATFAEDLRVGEALACDVTVVGLDAPKRAPLVLIFAEDVSGEMLELVGERRALSGTEPVWTWELPATAHAVIAPASEWLVSLEKA